jgi:glycosyltransferase involved in cell wall biosynthesis
MNHIANSSIIESHGTRDPASTPFFSIGVTTYNRPELLKQTLTSIINQTFFNFEVIVGNDYIKEPVTAEVLGISDPRIRFVNHAQNLGEVRNNNALIDLARGRYFTWQTDDDLYVPNFLEEVHSALVKYNDPPCVFTSFDFIYGSTYPDIEKTFSVQGQSFSGRQFLRMYLSGRIKALGCTGVYDKCYLKNIGGVESLANTSFVLYSEHLLLIRAGLLEQVAYIDAPLVKYRVHEESWGCATNKDYAIYKEAGKNLISKSIIVLSNFELREDFCKNIGSVLKFVVMTFLERLRAQDRLLSKLEIVPYLFSLKKQFDSIKGTELYWKAIFSLVLTGVILTWCLVTKSNYKAFVTQWLVGLARMLIIPFRRHRDDSVPSDE